MWVFEAAQPCTQWDSATATQNPNLASCCPMTQRALVFFFYFFALPPAVCLQQATAATHHRNAHGHRGCRLYFPLMCASWMANPTTRHNWHAQSPGGVNTNTGADWRLLQTGLRGGSLHRVFICTGLWLLGGGIA